MARRPVSETSVSNRNLERQLQAVQRKIAAQDALLVKRNDLLADMNRQGYTQARLAQILNVANIEVGAPLITPDAVYKALCRRRTAA